MSGWAVAALVSLALGAAFRLGMVEGRLDQARLCTEEAPNPTPLRRSPPGGANNPGGGEAPKAIALRVLYGGRMVGGLEKSGPYAVRSRNKTAAVRATFVPVIHLSSFMSDPIPDTRLSNPAISSDASQGHHRPPRMAKASPVPLLPRYLSDSR